MALRSGTRPIGKGRRHVLGMQAPASALRARATTSSDTL